ncbi:hypothetical protein QE152_g329 [Popillia japonica]|uniref:Polyprotein n=1 Tax=Popillia japonica TaxID=7064 RepID=A0AAW1NC93_POPJA
MPQTKDPSHKLQTYKLNTVTYGTTTAPFLAVRCLKQLAIENRENYPNASQTLETDFYVDDLLTGFDTEENALQVAEDLIAILKQGRFELRKWCSNSQAVVREITESTSNNKSLDHMVITDSESIKTLGLRWNIKQDSFEYTQAEETLNYNNINKRTILSTIAKLYDPMGLLGPINGGEGHRGYCSKYPSDIIDNLEWWRGPSWLLQNENAWPAPNAWWRGPSWLLQNEDEGHRGYCRDENAWPAPNARESYTYDDTALEKKKEQFTVTHVTTIGSEIFDKYSSFTKLTSIVAWCLRFKHNVFNKSDKLIGPLTVKEFNLATARLVKIAQQAEYSREIHDLKVNKSIHSSAVRY